MCRSISGPGRHEKLECYNYFGAPNLDQDTDHVYAVAGLLPMSTIPPNMPSNWHMFGPIGPHMLEYCLLHYCYG